jgi:hypothetical protein
MLGGFLSKTQPLGMFYQTAISTPTYVNFS